MYTARVTYRSLVLEVEGLVANETQNGNVKHHSCAYVALAAVACLVTGVPLLSLSFS